MAAKLSDAEFIERARASARQRSERQRERRLLAGRVATTIWLTSTTKAALTAAATAHGATLNETAEHLLLAGLNATTTPAMKPTAAEMTAELFPAPATTTDKEVLMMEVGKLLNEGHTGNEIARQLNASGQRTANGAAFTGQNVLRDYRAWERKNGAASEPQHT